MLTRYCRVCRNNPMNGYPENVDVCFACQEGVAPKLPPILSESDVRGIVRDELRLIINTQLRAL